MTYPSTQGFHFGLAVGWFQFVSAAFLGALVPACVWDALASRLRRARPTKHPGVSAVAQAQPERCDGENFLELRAHTRVLAIVGSLSGCGREAIESAMAEHSAALSKGKGRCVCTHIGT